MKRLTQYIEEKLKINSKSKISKNFSYFTQLMISFLFDDEIESVPQEEVKVISDWVDSHNIKMLNIITTEKVLKDFGLIDKENDISLEDVQKAFETKDFKIFPIDEQIYEYISKNLGDLKFKDNFGYHKIYIFDNSKENSLLTFQSQIAGNIFFNINN